MVGSTVQKSPRYIVDCFALLDLWNIDLLQILRKASVEIYEDYGIGVLQVLLVGSLVLDVDSHMVDHFLGGGL